MDLDWLKDWLSSNTELDVATAFADFEAEGGKGAEAFLDWLASTERVPPRVLVAVHASRAVHTGVPPGITWFHDADTEVDEDLGDALQPIIDAAYRPLGVIGRGGMAQVHLAAEDSLQRHVAYKEMSSEVAKRPNLVRRFLNEAQITAQLDHPNIVPVYAVDPSGRPAYTMKLINGKTLKRLLQAARGAASMGQPLPEELQLPALIEHFLKVCDAVSFAHSKGVIHRDLKPANIMIGPHHEVYVMDWGLAKVLAEPDEDFDPAQSITTTQGTEAMTRVGAVLGTLAYMAPEQYHATHAGPEADQFALGVILFEMVCGKLARTRDADAAMMAQRGALAPFAPGVAPELEAIVRKATSLSVRNRYASVDELADDVRRYLANEPIRARADTWRDRVQRSLSRNRERTFGLLVALLLIIALLAGGAAIKVQADARRALLRTHTVSERVGDAGRLASGLDQHFGRIETQVQKLVFAARNLLLHGTESDVHIYVTRAFDQLDTRPPDMRFSKHANREYSTSWPNVHVAYGEYEPAMPSLRRLAPLRHEMRQALLTPPLPGDDPDTAWLDHGGPVKYVSIGLGNGAVIELPGATWDPKDYDPRKRPWYSLGMRGTSPNWGNPFAGMAGGALLMPCSMAIRDDRGRELGVVSVQTSFDFVIGRHLVLEGAREVFLLDADGRIMLRGKELDLRGAAKNLEEVHATPPFHHPELVPVMKSRSSGHLALPDALLTWQRMHMQGWSLVIESDPLED